MTGPTKKPGAEQISSDSEMEAVECRPRAQGQCAAELGETWVKRHKAEFARLPKGAVVAINCRTGEYVVAATRLQVIDEYERRFGRETGYVHEIGGGVFVGWGGGVV